VKIETVSGNLQISARQNCRLEVSFIVVLAGAFRVGFSALVLEPIPDSSIANPQFGSNCSQGVAFRL
jgi:hypothetical protein